MSTYFFKIFQNFYLFIFAYKKGSHHQDENLSFLLIIWKELQRMLLQQMSRWNMHLLL